MHNSPEREARSSGLLSKIRGPLAAAILATLATAGCRMDRAGMHIEITDETANLELEKLRREFIEATQRTRYDSAAEKDGRIAEILIERDKLLQSQGIPPRTETWYASGDSANGPYMVMRVDEKACSSTPTCEVRPANSDYPEPSKN